MIRQTLTSFISIAGIGATILTLFVLLAPSNVAPSMAHDPYDDLYIDDPMNRDRDYERDYQDFRRPKRPFCGDAYRNDYKSHYEMDRWHSDYIRYGTATITVNHKVTYDYNRRQYRYDYKISYNGNKNVLMRWDVLDRMRSESPDSSCIIDLHNCHPHAFTMWSNEAPIMWDGTIQLYNNRPNTDDWNYWQCNQSNHCSGPVPASYPNEWWPKRRIRGNQCKIIENMVDSQS